MKNIHVLPTDKPSRFIINWGKDLCYKSKPYLMEGTQHIYITSDEEIKEGDWFLDDNNQISRSYRLSHVQFANPKKIILTTDQDLIKDGVQSIPDEFLEWFVKNPSSEEVEVEPLMAGFIDDEPSYYENMYEIIIPKEEPKQETPEEETLSKIKFVLSCNNDAQAIRLLEQYGQWQQERSYSEDDLKDAFQSGFTNGFNINSVTFEEWFEQFKKK